MSADSDLNVMIATLRRIAGPSIVRDIVAEAAPLVGQALKASASAGTNPTGETWAPTKDGGRAMANAASHVKATPSGGKITVTLAGPDVWHQLGARGEPKRAVIPTGADLPDAVAAAAAKGAGRVFDRLVRSL